DLVEGCPRQVINVSADTVVLSFPLEFALGGADQQQQVPQPQQQRPTGRFGLADLAKVFGGQPEALEQPFIKNTARIFSEFQNNADLAGHPKLCAKRVRGSAGDQIANSEGFFHSYPLAATKTLQGDLVHRVEREFGNVENSASAGTRR